MKDRNGYQYPKRTGDPPKPPGDLSKAPLNVLQAIRRCRLHFDIIENSHSIAIEHLPKLQICLGFKSCHRPSFGSHCSVHGHVNAFPQPSDIVRSLMDGPAHHEGRMLQSYQRRSGATTGFEARALDPMKGFSDDRAQSDHHVRTAQPPQGMRLEFFDQFTTTRVTLPALLVEKSAGYDVVKAQGDLA